MWASVSVSSCFLLKYIASDDMSCGIPSLLVGLTLYHVLLPPWVPNVPCSQVSMILYPCSACIPTLRQQLVLWAIVDFQNYRNPVVLFTKCQICPIPWVFSFPCQILLVFRTPYLSITSCFKAQQLTFKTCLNILCLNVKKINYHLIQITEL